MVAGFHGNAFARAGSRTWRRFDQQVDGSLAVASLKVDGKLAALGRGLFGGELPIDSDFSFSSHAAEDKPSARVFY